MSKTTTTASVAFAMSIAWPYDIAMEMIDRVIMLGNAARSSLVRKGIVEPATEGTQAERDLKSRRLGPLTKVTGSIRYNDKTGVVNGPVRDFDSKPISEGTFMSLYADVVTYLLELRLTGGYDAFIAAFDEAKSVEFEQIVAPRITESYANFKQFCEARRQEKAVDRPARTSRKAFEEEEEAVSPY